VENALNHHNKTYVTLYSFIEETVTWLTQARKFNKAEKVIKTVSRLNGVETEFQVPFVPASDHTVRNLPNKALKKLTLVN